jgi:hypothetical protein
VTSQGGSAVLWGAIGALAFLVFHGAYLLFGGSFLGVGPIAGVTVLVFAAATGTSHYAERRLLRRDRERDDR